jgi:type II secretory pathway component PulF
MMANQPKQSERFKHLSWQLTSCIEQLGWSFSQSLEHTQLFTEIELNWIRIGEHSGQLLQQCLSWQEQLQQQYSWQQQTKRLLMYPIMVFITMMGATLFLLLEVIPQLGAFLLGLGISRDDLPLMTHILLLLSENLWMSLAVIIGLILIGMGLLWFFRVSVLWFLFRYRFLAQLFGDLHRLLNTGISLNEGLLMIHKNHSHPYLKVQLQKTSDLLMQGHSISEAFEKAGFADMIIRLMNIAQQTGQLIHTCEHLKSYYQQQFDAKMVKIQSLIAPMMTLFLGGLLALLLMGVLSPVYDSLQHIL